MSQSVIVVPVDPTGQVLLLRRSPTDRWRPGYWNFPGGRVESGEPVPLAAARELAEEAGIHIDPKFLQWVLSYRDGGLRHVFSVRLVARPLVQGLDGEHDAAVWTTLEQLPYPVIEGTSFVVEQLLHEGL